MSHFVGIDLGTTFSAVARIDERGRADMIGLGRGEKALTREGCAGGSDLVDIEAIKRVKYRYLRCIDQKLWVALSCPVKGIEFDARTLAFVDGDGDAPRHHSFRAVTDPEITQGV